MLPNALFLLLPWLLSGSGPAGAARDELFRDDFESGLAGWELGDSTAIRVIESSDAAHGRVLLLSPAHARMAALIRGSERWPAYRIEGDVLFPTAEQNYLGLIYDYRDDGERVDLGSLYIKGNDSYVRVNPRRDWNPARQHPRGAVLTGRVTAFLGDRTVAYFRTTLRVPAGGARLEFSSIDDLAIWVDGRFEGYGSRGDVAWYDFGRNPEHPPTDRLALAAGTRHVLIRVRGGQYATGGFFARVVRDTRE